MLFLVSALLAPANAADATKPHPHQGVVKGWSGAPERPALTAADLAVLAEGKTAMKQSKGDSGGTGIAVQDIHASPDVIWGRIVDYAAYPQMVDNVDACEVYDQNGEHIKVRFVVSAPLVSIEYYIDHVWKQDEGWMTWRLDYSRQSDLDDSVGFWRVEALPDRPGWSRVYYSVDVRIKGWVPPIIENVIVKQGLTKATAWVKRESELKAQPSTRD